MGKNVFFDPVRDDGWHHDALESKNSIQKLIEADAYENIFPVIAHDMSLDDVMDLIIPQASQRVKSERMEGKKPVGVSQFVHTCRRDTSPVATFGWEVFGQSFQGLRHSLGYKQPFLNATFMRCLQYMLFELHIAIQVT